MKKKCSIIIRTKNEERLIASCLSAIFNQTYKNFEIIIVDNESTDKTLEKIKKFPNIKYVGIQDYLPGCALNIGIRESSGEYIVCISGHCIPVDEFWLENLVKRLESDASFAGVYGRQEPMSFSTPSDKRDLLLVFGLDEKIQSKDSFFHNANSIIHRKLWNKVPFDEKITNIEDRIWGQEMLNLGYKLAYEPLASVYHYHGIHQNGNQERVQNIVKIIQNMEDKLLVNNSLDAENLNIIVIIPIKGEDDLIGDKPQMSFTINSALESKYISDVYIDTSSKETAKLAKSLGANCPFLRSDNLIKSYISLDSVIKDFVCKLEDSEIYPDLLVILEETFPFRSQGLIDKMIERILETGLDTLIAAKPESGSLWQETEDHSIVRLDSGDTPRLYKEKTYLGLKGLCCITHPEFARNETLLGNKIGLYEVDSPLASFEVRTNSDRQIAAELLN